MKSLSSALLWNERMSLAFVESNKPFIYLLTYLGKVTQFDCVIVLSVRLPVRKADLFDERIEVDLFLADVNNRLC